MPVQSPNPQYSAAIAGWERIRHCLEGDRAVKAAGATYLPMLTGQSPEAYNAYKQRGLFYNATGRTHEATVGFLMRKPPSLTDMPAGLDSFMKDVDLNDTTFNGYARRAAESLTSTGRGGTLIEWSEEESRPYFAYYREVDIINWREERIGGSMKLTLLVLREFVPDPAYASDVFASNTITQYRVCILDGGVYRVEIHQGPIVAAAPGGMIDTPGVSPIAPGTMPNADFTKREDILPVRRAKSLPFIPFVFHNADGKGSAIGKAPLNDIAAVNISHFQNSVDLEHGRHICGIPQPWLAGFTKDEYVIGSTKAWIGDGVDSKAEYLEFKGTGLGELSGALKEKEEQMAALGARLIEPRGGQAEAENTVALRANAETSAMTQIAQNLGETLSQALQWADWWIRGDGDFNEGITVSINQDFVSAKLTPEQLTAWVSARQANMISQETFLWNLRQGEAFPPDWTNDEEQESLESNPPMVAPATEAELDIKRMAAKNPKPAPAALPGAPQPAV